MISIWKKIKLKFYSYNTNRSCKLKIIKVSKYAKIIFIKISKIIFINIIFIIITCV